ncbi:MAG: transcription termination/antitermination protein NusA [Planctomycetes bacterium]|nr:transcription termination/antitermination protein NusA [Planctomycetota bacterium]
MNGELLRIVEAIHKDRSIDKELIFEGIESALTSAAKKHFNTDDETIVRIDRETGKIVTSKGDLNIDPTILGRIAAQTAKQMIIQKIREAERNVVFADFETKKGEILSGTILRQDGPHYAVNLGKIEAILPKSEQMPGETYKIGDRVRAAVIDVKKKGQRVRVVLSRAHTDFVKRLFELEVPEIAEKTIEIKALAREPGHRSKVAVQSLNARVDAVGACVGVRGSRIRNIVDELGGEKVDIIRYDPSPEIMIKNSLKPAEVSSIELDYDRNRATVIVEKDQLSLAIGRAGQNVRLASRLTSWEIDVMGPPEEEAPPAAAAEGATPAAALDALVPATEPAAEAAVAAPVSPGEAESAPATESAAAPGAEDPADASAEREAGGDSAAPSAPV